MGVASGCGEQEAGVASGSGWNLWVWLLGVVVRRYIDFLILLIPTPLVFVPFCSSIPTFLVHFVKCFSFLGIFGAVRCYIYIGAGNIVCTFGSSCSWRGTYIGNGRFHSVYLDYFRVR